jgi:hypothetical protein
LWEGDGVVPLVNDERVHVDPREVQLFIGGHLLAASFAFSTFSDRVRSILLFNL